MNRKSNECPMTRELCKELEKLGARITSYVGSLMQEASLPDRRVSHRMWSGFVEFKSSKHEVTTKQRLYMKSLRQRGDDCVVARFTADGTIIVATPREERLFVVQASHDNGEAALQFITTLQRLRCEKCHVTHHQEDSCYA